MTDKSKKVVEKQEQENDQDKNQAQQKKGRVIIRNLIFDISEKHLKGLLGKYGEIIEINIPVNPSTNKSKGFAFVQFANKNCALKAINELNGTQWKGRNIVLDLAVSKEEFKNHQQPQNQQDKQQSKQKAKKSEQIEEEEGDDDEKKMDEEEESEDDEDQEDDDEEDEDEDDDEEEEDEDDDKNNQNKKGKNQQGQKKLFENEDLSKTCFVRNLSYDSTDKDLRTFCQNFGKVEMAKVCMNHETGSNKGTGFVKFQDAQVALKLIAKSNELSENCLQQKNKKNASNIHDIFSGISELDLEMNGRRIIFLEAKKREEVSKVMEEKLERNSITLDKVKTLDQLEKFDRQGKRNVHLAKLGIFEEEKSMTNEEKEKRRIHLQEKLNKLKNPNNYVSSTRIALMNIPKDEFQEEDIRLYAQAALIKEHGQEYFKKQNPIKQVLLLRDKNKLDKDGVPKSRGIGFIEFNTHEQALSFLEYCVNDKQNFEKKYKKTPIIEFSIEDARKMAKKNKLLEKVKQKQAEKKKEKKELTEEELESKKKILKNTNEAAKIKIQNILDQSNCSDMSLYEEGKKLLKDIKSRGIKQRMAKLLRKKFNIQNEDNQKSNKLVEAISKQEEKIKNKNSKEEKRKQLLKQKVQEEKKQKVAEQKKKQKEIDDELDVDASELIKAVSKELKKNKIRRQNLEDYDELDDVVEKHMQKKVKKIKQESSAL
ncbi:RNA recognition motif 2 in vertebrate RNA-binding protein (macronuclear) [Tetrahymena thermophila SB210]|uniref:RNA recognition motif 2 in vertebrate RNA-binding protein n=1 Tax=Tetrahymena thermophila (strain SB210) TaxID=312017 RepID=I7MA65_TETTS|nr:RNA recognition motif 2 in vertebrate RNA-binding protein [Tetrahymena thermophila SB210]EAS03801.1 RNA recognition motif 2 in vertebrate RNA-binding protein [Tetrahymena thermophila SB210]|eukprot:XP_001024046.1 RNA recognition motif 2 in vertebrate RNA-binding protein [Tetrahymena thermophila SB210]